MHGELKRATWFVLSRHIVCPIQIKGKLCGPIGQSKWAAPIRIFDRLILVLSEHSLTSRWVTYGVVHAREREKRDGIQRFLPISLSPFDTLKDWTIPDPDTGSDTAREVREYFIADFSNWTDHASYPSSFQRLLRDLRGDKTQQQRKS